MNKLVVIIKQAKTLTPFFIYLYLPPLLCLSWISLISMNYEISIGDFMIDMTAYTKVPLYIGVISNIGVLFMCACASISIFTWALLKRIKGNSRLPTFLLYFGLLTILLMLDDLFLFHEELFPILFGLSEKSIFMVYGVLMLFGIIFFSKSILKTDYLVFLSALFFLGVSIFFDLIQTWLISQVGEWHSLFEDGFKFIGMIGWFGYFARICFIEINKFLACKEIEIPKVPDP